MGDESFVGDISDDFGYAWKFVKPRSHEISGHFIMYTIFQGQPISGWVCKFPNWEDRQREVSTLTRGHTARSEAASIHTVWNLREMVTKYGAETSIRELKKRCDAGAIVGCSMYLNMSTQLINVALGGDAKRAGGKSKDLSTSSKDPAFRAPAMGMLESAEGNKWVNKIEALHEQFPDERIPKNVIEDLKDEFREELERRAGRQIPRLPEDASPQDIAESKRIAEELAKGTFVKKPHPQAQSQPPQRAPAVMPPGPIPMERIRQVESEEEELERINKRIEELRNAKAAKQKPSTEATQAPAAPQLKPTPIKGLDLMEDEIRQKMEEIRARRAAGQGQAGESQAKYELSTEEYKKASKMTFHELIGQDICPECLHKMINGKCSLHGTKQQILQHIAKSIAATVPKRENEPGTTEITVGGHDKMPKEKRIELAKMIAHGEVRETADVIIAPGDYTQWTFADFEPFIKNLEDTEELRELYEFVGTSDKLTESEGDALRSMIDVRIKDIDTGRN